MGRSVRVHFAPGDLRSGLSLLPTRPNNMGGLSARGASDASKAEGESCDSGAITTTLSPLYVGIGSKLCGTARASSKSKREFGACKFFCKARRSLVDGLHGAGDNEYC